MKTLGMILGGLMELVLLIFAGFTFVVLSIGLLKTIDKAFPPEAIVYAVYGVTDCEFATDGTGKEIPCTEAMKGERRKRYSTVWIAPKSLRTAERSK